MKKILAVLAMIAMVAMMFAGCAAPKCDGCGAEGETTHVSYEGEEANLCEDCYTLFQIGTGDLDISDVDISDIDLENYL